jgi:hypothetical protein
LRSIHSGLALSEPLENEESLCTIRFIEGTSLPGGTLLLPFGELRRLFGHLGGFEILPALCGDP